MNKIRVSDIVLYTLSSKDADEINRLRTTSKEIAERIKNNNIPHWVHETTEPIPATWPLGAQAHIGTEVKAGDVLPMIVVKVFDEPTIKVNGQVFLNWNDTFWAIFVEEGNGRGQWKWDE